MGLKANESKNIKKRPPEFWAARAKARNKAIRESEPFAQPSDKPDDKNPKPRRDTE